MSDSGLDALEAERAVETKLAEAGADQIRRHSFSDAPEAAPDMGTPAETVSDQPRNDLGQFASQEPEQPEEQAPEEVQAEAPTGQDPAVQALLAKYGGDPDKALAAAVHAQRRLGELGNELGQERQQNAEYEQMIAELRGLREDMASRQQTPLDQATVDWFDQAVVENPQQAMAWAQEQKNPLLLQRGLATWKQIDPYEAAVYTNNANNQALYQQVEQRLSASQQLPVDAGVNLALMNVRSRHPEYVNYDNAIEGTLAKHPFAAKALESAAASGDAAQLEGAIETLYSLAVGDTLQSLALTGPAPEDTTSSSEVVTPTTSETREQPPAPSGTDQFRSAFQEEADRLRKGVWTAS